VASPGLTRTRPPGRDGESARSPTATVTADTAAEQAIFLIVSSHHERRLNRTSSLVRGLQGTEVVLNGHGAQAGPPLVMLFTGTDTVSVTVTVVQPEPLSVY
jgi:hypothetical protein